MIMEMMNLWANVGAKDGQGDGKEVKYVKFPEGISIIRLLDEAPMSAWQHWIGKAQGGKGCGVLCIGKECPICEIIKKEKADKVKVRTYTAKMTHSINVLVKKLGTQDINEVMVLEQGNGLFGQIKDQMTMLQTMGMSTDLRNVDLIVNRTGSGFNDTKYSVMVNVATAKPLTEDEKKLEKYVLAEIKPKLDRGQVLELMNGKSLDEVCKTDEVVEEVAMTTTGDFVESPVDLNMPF